MTASVLEPGQIEPPAGEIPFLRLADRNSIFQQRAARLRSLAQDHRMADFLTFMARLSDAQQHALDSFPSVPLPREAQLAASRQHGPPLAAQGWKRDLAWQAALQQIIQQIREFATPGSQDALAQLRQANAATIEQAADALLAGNYDSLDLAAAPFIAAALQVYWVHMATRLGNSAFSRNDMPTLCPVCASPPVVSLVTIGREHGLRYLHCSLCSSDWHMVRTKCSNCESSKGLAYYSIENSSGSVKAETCSECGSYLKILYQDKDPLLDPIADDLATLALDILMGESGSMRSGPNLMLFHPTESLA